MNVSRPCTLHSTGSASPEKFRFSDTTSVFQGDLITNQLYFTYVQRRNKLTRRAQLALLVATAKAQHQVQGGLLLDVVVRERAAVLEKLAREDEALLFGGGCCSQSTFALS